jgi:hypothetical protein
MKVTAPEALRYGHHRDIGAMRRSLEQSILYSEGLGIDLALGTDAAYLLVRSKPSVRRANFGNDGQEDLLRIHPPWADVAEKNRGGGMGLPCLSCDARGTAQSVMTVANQRRSCVTARSLSAATEAA